ncbi:MAG: acyltransferase [Bacteroidales bacterium]|nr:acyltransferase [Bacteroidales bacterium]
MNLGLYQKELFTLKTENAFNQMCLFAFQYQYNSIDIYKEYVDSLGIKLENILHYSQIPFLPISFFKSHQLLAKNTKAQLMFQSSGTSMQTRSKHFVTQASVYESSFTFAFTQFYGDIDSYCILALLPSYLENGDSSLVYMTQHLINKSKHPKSGFYLNHTENLRETILELEENKQKTLLIGVSYALLDLIEKDTFQLKNTIVMETGGMKGRRIEMVREELHDHLKKGFGIQEIHSEYGMTELLSQAYSKGKGIFQSPSWMKILIRDVNDPFTLLPKGQNGGINIIDLANIFSISFIETKDLGVTHSKQSFEILGRFDDSDIRGCNLLIV